MITIISPPCGKCQNRGLNVSKKKIRIIRAMRANP